MYCGPSGIELHSLVAAAGKSAGTPEQVTKYNAFMGDSGFLFSNNNTNTRGALVELIRRMALQPACL
jgi:hypothetical protein